MNITGDTSAPLDKPTFLWAIENANYSSADVNPVGNVTGWGEGVPNKGSDSNGYDYSKLGLTIVPGVFITPKGDPTIDVGVLPGGLDHKKAGGTFSRGNVFYFFNPADAKIKREIDSLGTINPGGRKLGMGISPIIYREDSLKRTDLFYTADSEGNILFCDTSKASDVNNWKIDSVFKMAASDDSVVVHSPVVIPHAMVYARRSEPTTEEWLFGGTADIAGPGSRDYGDNSRKLINKEQFIFGLNLSNIKKKDASDPLKWTPHNTIYKTSDLVELDYHDYSSNDIKPVYRGYVPVNTNITLGWYLTLRPTMPKGSDEQGTEQEYVSAPPFLFNERLYVGTFISYTKVGSDIDCKSVGVSKLYSLSPSTGAPLVEPKTMENLKIVGFSGSGSRLSIAVQELMGGAVKDAVDKLDDAKPLAGGSVIETKAPGAEPVPIPLIPTNTPYIQYWREKFQ